MHPHFGWLTSQLIVTQTCPYKNSEPDGPGVGRGIMVCAGQLHFGPVTFCWRIINCQLDELIDLTDGILLHSQMQQFRGNAFCGPSESLQEVIVVLPVIGYARGPQPAGYGSATTSQQHAQYDCQEILSASSIQSSGENLTPVCYPVRQRPCSHRGAPSGRELSW